MARYSHYVEVIFFKACAELKAECGRTRGGAVWWVVDPLLSIFVYYVVFSLILQRGGNGFVAFLCVGIIIWRWFQCSVMRGAGSVLAESSLMTKVYMPKIIFPMISMLADLFKFSITFALLLVFLWLSGQFPGLSYWALPVVLLAQVLFMGAVIGLLAAVVPLVPDVRQILNHGLHLLFFLSGIFFSVESLDPSLRKLVLLNPVAGLIAAYRQVLLDRTWPDWSYLGVVMLCGLVGMAAAGYLLNRLDRVYPKLC